MHTSASSGPGSEERRTGNPPSARHHQDTSPLRTAAAAGGTGDWCPGEELCMGMTVSQEGELLLRPGSVCGMRLGVLDVGSNTVHMLVVDAHPGARPLPAFSHKVDLRLAPPPGARKHVSAGG